jgi:hypothetical protein
VHRLLRKIKITEQADQSCQDSPRIHAIKGVEQFAYLFGGTLGHDDDLSKPATPNQFGCGSFGTTAKPQKSGVFAKLLVLESQYARDMASGRPYLLVT